jgi:hypothetical protein
MIEVARNVNTAVDAATDDIHVTALRGERWKLSIAVAGRLAPQVATSLCRAAWSRSGHVWLRPARFIRATD